MNTLSDESARRSCNLVHIRWTVAALVAVILMSSDKPAIGRIELIAREGDKLPVSAGELTWTRVGSGLLNDNGRVAIHGDVRVTGVPYDLDNYGIATGSPGALEVVTYSRANVPQNLGTGLLRRLGVPVLNNTGQLILSASFGNSVHPTPTLLSWTNSGLHGVSEHGNLQPGTQPGITTLSFDDNSLLLNDAGQLMFYAAGGSTGLYASTPDDLLRIAAGGQMAPGTEPGTTISYVYHEASLNKRGQAAYRVTLSRDGSENQTAIYLGYIGSEPSIIAKTGDLLPGVASEVMIGVPESPSLNDHGQLVFATELYGPGVNDDEEHSNRRAIVGGLPNNLVTIARDGDLAPGTGDDVRLLSMIYPVINNAGHVAFRTELTGNNVNSSNNEAFYIAQPMGMALIARTGDPAPGMPEGVTFTKFNRTYSTPSSNTLVLNDSGQVAFNAAVSCCGRGGLWTGDGIDLIKVQGPGDIVDGRVVDGAGTFTYSGGSDGRRRALNELGQILYATKFWDRTTGLYLFTPELKWRGTEGDNRWDSHRNWTLSLSPGHVHDVLIKGPTDVYVIGPTVDTTVKSLTIGDDGDEQAELDLQPTANLISLESVKIGSSGVLSGNGEITTNLLLNNGLVDVGNVTHKIVIDGDYVQGETGTLQLEISNESLSDTLNIAQNAMLMGEITVTLGPDSISHHSVAYWDIVMAESIDLDADLRLPVGFGATLLADEFGTTDVLRVWSTPEPSAVLLMGICSALIASISRSRRR